MRFPAPLFTLLLVSVLACCGCSKRPALPSGTGSRDTVKKYFEALVRRDWDKAYAILDADSKAKCSQEHFSRLGADYRAALGFEPDAVHIQTCDEKGAEGIAHVIITGRVGPKTHRYKDAITVRRGGAEWQVVLPETFGQAGEQ